MLPRGRRLSSSLLAGLLALAGGCGDGDEVTGPIVDAEAPTVVLTSAPATGAPEHELALSFRVTDDVALEVVTVDWGVAGTPVESIAVAGTADSGSCAHAFAEPGNFTIVVEVTDASGRRASATHAVSIAWPPPGAPAHLGVAVTDNLARIWWTPGAWGTSQEVVLSRLDAVEPDQVRVLGDNVDRSVSIPDLAWDASYTVTIASVNPAGRAESVPASIQVRAPEPALLTRFSAFAADPTCLALEWDAAEAAERYRVVLTGDAAGGTFEELVPAGATDVVLCAASYPIVDGVTYEARVVSLLGGREYGSNSLAFRVEFAPELTAAGTWSGTWVGPDAISIQFELQLEDAEGDVTGQWTAFVPVGSLGSGPVSGTRVQGAVELTLEQFGLAEFDELVRGEFLYVDTIEGQLVTSWGSSPLTLSRD